MASLPTSGVRVALSAEQLIAAVRRMRRQDREALVEDLVAATSPEYLASIREARADRAAGRVRALREVFQRR